MTTGARQGETEFVVGVLALGFAALLLFSLALIALSFPVGIYTVFFTSLSQSFSAASDVSGIYVFIGPILAVLPLDASMGSFFLGLSAVYACMLLLASRQGGGLVSSLKLSTREGFGALLSNYLLVTVTAVGFLAFTILLVDEFETSVGVPVGGLSGDAMNLLMSLTVAPLREEAGFRLLIIGLVAALACLGRPWRVPLKALWRPSVAYEDTPMSALPRAALGMALAASAIAFGLLHISSNSGWEVGKLPEAAYAGVVLGYLYIRYGFHVAVLTHWGIDYVGSVFAFFGQGAFGVPWASEPGFILQQVVSVNMLEVTGVASFLVVAYLGMQKIAARRAAAVQA